MAKGRSRSGFLATAVAAGSVKLPPQVAGQRGGKRVLVLIWGKSSGAMRAIDLPLPQSVFR